MLIYYHHIMKTGGTAIRKWMENSDRYANAQHRQHTSYSQVYIIKNHFYVYNHITNIKNIKIKFEPVKHIISIRDPIDRHTSKYIKTDLDFLNLKPVKHIISIRDPISRHISVMNYSLQEGYEIFSTENGIDQLQWLNNNLSQMNSYEFIRQEFHQEDFNKAFENDDILSLQNVTQVKKYSWDTMSEEEKDKLRQRYEPEYNMLKSLGIQYNIP